MSIQEELLEDFSGGLQVGESPDEFSRRQWSLIDGFVFEDERRLRTQWMSHVMHGVDEDNQWVASVDDFLVLVRSTDVRYRPLPSTGSAPGSGGWSTVSALTINGTGLRALCKVPVRDNDGGWQEGLLLNAVDDAHDKAVLLYRDGSSLVAEELEERYPQNDEVDDAMPFGNVGAMWGDFLVLGDIRWVVDDNSPISEANSARFPHGLWFSQPNSIKRWDPIDVEFVGQRSGRNTVVGIFPLDVGLLALSTDSVDLFRGNPTAYVPEVLRDDLGCPHPDACTYWPAANVVVWIDRRGRVWQTNGEDVIRLDQPLPEVDGSERAIVSWGEYLVVRRGRDTWAFRLFGESGAWTRLLRIDPISLHTPDDETLYWVEQDASVRRFDAVAPRDINFVSRVTSRPLGHPHRRTFWHRGGVRYRGAGTLIQLEWSADRGEFTLEEEYPNDSTRVGVGGALPFELPYGFDADPTEVFVNQTPRVAVSPAPGPAREVTFGGRFRGDVTLESFAVWWHEGSDER